MKKGQLGIPPNCDIKQEDINCKCYDGGERIWYIENGKTIYKCVGGK